MARMSHVYINRRSPQFRIERTRCNLFQKRLRRGIKHGIVLCVTIIDILYPGSIYSETPLFHSSVLKEICPQAAGEVVGETIHTVLTLPPVDRSARIIRASAFHIRERYATR